MKTFKIQASYTTFLDATIEAENIDEAREIAYNMDGGDFKDTKSEALRYVNYAGFTVDWNVDNIFEEAI